jgi:hypothetical protein
MSASPTPLCAPYGHRQRARLASALVAPWLKPFAIAWAPSSRKHRPALVVTHHTDRTTNLTTVATASATRRPAILALR